MPNPPSCPACGPDRPMALISLHTDARNPDQLSGLYRCPTCGLERRLPLALREADAA